MTSLNKLIEHFERQLTTNLYPRCNCSYRAEVAELLRELRTLRKANAFSEGKRYTDQ